MKRLKAIFLGLMMLLAGAAPGLATQGHSDPEGLYVHQMSHLMFVFSMGILVYWLRRRELIQKPGWRQIQYAAFFFILWTVDAFSVHLLDEQLKWITVRRIGALGIQIEGPNTFLEVVYYIAKLDHLLCVPGMIFLYAGLKQLARSATDEDFEHSGEAS